jgi:hypothetical protein
MGAPLYLHLPHGSPLPALPPGPFKALLIAESIAMEEWREQTCESLARAGCRFFLAWGQDAREWRDAMNGAAAAAGGDLLIATWHPDQPLSEAMWFSVHQSDHPELALKYIVILHLTPQAQREEVLDQFSHAIREEM